jgi:uncharacterized damage-inducible protein DinB
MKDYFIRLFDYDRHANLLILDTINKAREPKKPVQLMAHALAAQQIWLTRCKGLAAPSGALWPDWPADTFTDIIGQNHKDWIDYLSGVAPGDFDHSIGYKTLKGEGFENKLCDILAHVINHGTHHRAQAGQHLLAAGADKLPMTDYIFYLR